MTISIPDIDAIRIVLADPEPQASLEHTRSMSEAFAGLADAIGGMSIPSERIEVGNSYLMRAGQRDSLVHSREYKPVNDQRRASRKRVLYEGRVVFNNRYSIIECTIRDISATGAKIAFPHTTPLLPEVELEIFKTQQNFRARVMWSDGKSHGLMFIDQTGKGRTLPEITPQAIALEAAPQSRSATTIEIQAVIDETRHRIAQLAGVAPQAVRLKLDIGY